MKQGLCGQPYSPVLALTLSGRQLRSLGTKLASPRTLATTPSLHPGVLPASQPALCTTIFQPQDQYGW